MHSDVLAADTEMVSSPMDLLRAVVVAADAVALAILTAIKPSAGR
jgi:hypothetical protein